MEIELYQLKNIMMDMAEIGYKKALKEMGQLKPFLSKNEASKLFGRKTVERWIREGLIEAHKDGNNTSTIRLDRLELEALAKASNRATYGDIKI